MQKEKKVVYIYLPIVKRSLVEKRRCKKNWISKKGCACSIKMAGFCDTQDKTFAFGKWEQIFGISIAKNRAGWSSARSWGIESWRGSGSRLPLLRLA